MSKSRLELLTYIDTELRMAGFKMGLFAPEDVLQRYPPESTLFDEEIIWFNALITACYQFIDLPGDDSHIGRLTDMSPYVQQLLAILESSFSGGAVQ